MSTIPVDFDNEKGPEVDERTSQMLGAWSANSFAILVANLKHRQLIDDDMVNHFQEGLRQMEDHISSNQYEVVDHIDYILEGDWITKNGRNRG